MIRFITCTEKLVDINQKCIYQSMISIRWLEVRLEIMGSLITFFAAVFAVLGKGNGVSAETAGLSISYAMIVSLLLAWVIRIMADIETNIVANERMEKYTMEVTEADWITVPVVSL